MNIQRMKRVFAPPQLATEMKSIETYFHFSRKKSLQSHQPPRPGPNQEGSTFALVLQWSCSGYTPLVATR